MYRAKLTACVLQEDSEGALQVELREFRGFKRRRQAVAEWVATCHPKEVAMESSGIYWKSPYPALERLGIRALVVNARHVKQVPGRKGDIDGQSARAMVKGLIGGESPEQVLAYGSKRLKAADEELLDVLDGRLTGKHRFVLGELMDHIEDLKQRIVRFGNHLRQGLALQQELS